MPSTLQAVRDYLDRRLTIDEHTDPTGNGLLVIGRDSVQCIGAALNTSRVAIERAAAALNTSRVAIERAAAAHVDLLLVHHAPWAEIDLHLRDDKLALLREHGISLYAAHEALDRSQQDSTGGAVARLLRLTVEQSGGDDLTVATAPPMPFAKWLEYAAEVLGTRVRAWPNNAAFRRVALVPGGGGTTTYLARAAGLGCDTFVTGEGSLFTELFARESGLSLVYASHTATEFPAICEFAESVAAAVDLSYVAILEAEEITGGGRAPLEYGS